MKPDPKLLLTTSPFLKHHEDTAFIMWQVNYSLVPVVAAAMYFFGISAALVILSCVLGAMIPEWFMSRRGDQKKNSIKDGTALITGVLLALTLPPGIPLWMAFVGGASAILLGKLMFGGLGFNIFNPALLGRAFLQAAFPESMTTWATFSTTQSFWSLQGNNLSLPFLKSGVNAVTSATPLAQMKFESQATETGDLFLGFINGSMGETCAIVILLCGIYLGIRNIFNWRIPVSIFVTVFVLASIFYWINPDKHPQPFFHLFSGGLVLGAAFMATDPITSPITQKGCWIFGIGIGVIVMVIRLFGGLPEGVMYAILIMNGATPLLNRVTQPRIYGVG